MLKCTIASATNCTSTCLKHTIKSFFYKNRNFLSIAPKSQLQPPIASSHLHIYKFQNHLLKLLPVSVAVSAVIVSVIVVVFPVVDVVTITVILGSCNNYLQSIIDVLSQINLHYISYSHITTNANTITICVLIQILHM